MNPPVLIYCPAWGERYVNRLLDWFLPGLLANLQRLAVAEVSRAVSVDLYIGAHDEERVRRAPILDRIAHGAALNLNIIPAEELPGVGNAAGRDLLERVEIDSLVKALAQGADWLPFQADRVISDGFIPGVLAELDHGYGAVAGCPFRVSEEAFWPLAAHERVFDADRLYRLSLRAMHPVTLKYFMQEPPSIIPAAPHQVFFRCDGGFICHAFQWCLYGVRTPQLDPIAADCVPLDCRVLQAAPYKTYQAAPPGQFYSFGLDAAGGIPEFAQSEVTPYQVARSMFSFAAKSPGMKAMRATFVNWAFYRLPEGMSLDLPATRDEDVAVTEVLRWTGS